MSNGIKGIVTQSLIDRVKNILFNPVNEWPAIASETTTSRAIYVQYVAVLAAIGAIAGFIGQSIIGVSVPLFGTYRAPFFSGLISAAVMYALTLVAVFLVALIVDALAPTFGGQKDSLRALKVTAYSYTPAWIAAVFQIIPSLAWIGIIAGLYGIYLLYLGLPVLMRAPKDKAIGYTATVCVAAIVMWFVIGLIAGSVMGGVASGTYGGLNGYSRMASNDEAGKQVAASWLSSLFGGKTEEDRQRVAHSLQSLAKMGEDEQKAEDEARARGENPNEAGAKQVDLAKALGAMGQIATGGSHIKPVDFRALKELLPEELPGMKREGTSGESNSAMGISASKATAEYSGDGDKHITVEITDMGSLSGLAGLAVKFDPNLDKETDAGYERTTHVDGQLMHEQYDSSDHSGEVEFIAGNRFAIAVKGSNVSMDELTEILKKVDYQKLSDLAEAK